MPAVAPAPEAAAPAVAAPAPEEPAHAVGSSNPLFGKPSDHDEVVGHWAIAYYGISGVPIGDQSSATATVSAPAIGVRRWLTERYGLDVGLGFGYSSSGGTAYAPKATDVKLASTGRFAVVAHGGVPISVYHGGHYNALIIPELTLGLANGIDDTNPSTTTDDVLLHGFLFGLGVRAGAEWHLNFLDIPQASLQITLRAGLDFESRNTEHDSSAPAGLGGAGQTRTSLAFATNALDMSKLLGSGIQLFLYL